MSLVRLFWIAAAAVAAAFVGYAVFIVAANNGIDTMVKLR